MVLAVVGLVALVLAALTGSTQLAIVVVALAVAGVVQLFRDWRSDRRQPTVEPVDSAVEASRPEPASGTAAALAPDEFTPDISTIPDGPSSDARADQS